MAAAKPRVAVHKFSSCDGCQLAFLNMGEDLLQLASAVELVHFIEAGLVAEDASVDIAFVEGSISTPDDHARIQNIRDHCQYLVTIGACATSGGIQALRNMNDAKAWTEAIYAQPEYINSLDKVSPIKEHVKVDLELWGCPVSSQQIIHAVRDLLLGVLPAVENDKLCMECKRNANVCVMVTKGQPCVGAMTRGGCGAICPHMGRDCYGCYGPAENPNPDALATHLQGLGMLPGSVARRLLFIHSAAPELNSTGVSWQGMEEGTSE